MAIAYLQLNIKSRANGSNIISASAYQSGEKLKSSDDNRTKNYLYKAREIESKDVLLPTNAPKEYRNRQNLWQSVEQIEKSGKAQLARSIVLALPNEVNARERQQIVFNFCMENFVRQGMCCDYAIHNKKDGNPHAHILLTMRGIDEKGQWQNKKSKIYALDKSGNKIPIIDKNTGKQKIGDKGRLMFKTETVNTNNWNDKNNLEKWRHSAEVNINRTLQQKNLPLISMQSYERQGIDKKGQVHEGQYVTAIERKRTAEGKPPATEKRQFNLYVKEYNQREQNTAKEQKQINRDLQLYKQIHGNFENLKEGGLFGFGAKISPEHRQFIQRIKSYINSVDERQYTEQKPEQKNPVIGREQQQQPEKPEHKDNIEQAKEKLKEIQQQQPEKPEHKDNIEQAKEKLKELEQQQKKPKARLVKSEYQKQKELERQNSRGGRSR